MTSTTTNGPLELEHNTNLCYHSLLDVTVFNTLSEHLEARLSDKHQWMQICIVDTYGHFHEYCPISHILFHEKPSSDISRKCILSIMIRAGTVKISENEFFQEIKCSGITSFMDFMMILARPSPSACFVQFTSGHFVQKEKFVFFFGRKKGKKPN